MSAAALTVLAAVLLTGAQSAMTSVSPVASKAKANQRSTKAAPGEDETHLLVYKVSRHLRARGDQHLRSSRAAMCLPLIAEDQVPPLPG